MNLFAIIILALFNLPKKKQLPVHEISLKKQTATCY